MLITILFISAGFLGATWYFGWWGFAGIGALFVILLWAYYILTELRRPSPEENPILRHISESSKAGK